ncbi:MAG: hypothetical protein WKI04_18510 [Ferruginibacter sp.]
MLRILQLILYLLLSANLFAQMPFLELKKKAEAYDVALNKLRKKNHNHRELPAIDFFLFGMGNRKKMIYKNGSLIDALNGNTLFQWTINKELIIPSEYTVYIKTKEEKEVIIFENEKGVFLKEGKKQQALAQSNLNLPEFKGNSFAPVLKVLHHEILINIINGKPVPNFFVYQKPWYRDATLMAMVLKKTNNLRLIKDWIMGIRDPFDRNNHGISEADNPGQVLFLISLVGNAQHTVVKTVLDSLQQFIKHSNEGAYIEGKTDYALHPVFQTKWIKYGLNSLHIADSFNIPKVYDSYSSLFWWHYKEAHVEGKRFDEGSGIDYPYLVWAEDHFFNEHKGYVGDRSYPLSWEANASDANYPGMKIVDERYVSLKLSPPHTWHAAEMFLLLIEQNH